MVDYAFFVNKAQDTDTKAEMTSLFVLFGFGYGFAGCDGGSYNGKVMKERFSGCVD